MECVQTRVTRHSQTLDVVASGLVDFASIRATICATSSSSHLLQLGSFERLVPRPFDAQPALPIQLLLEPRDLLQKVVISQVTRPLDELL